VFKFRAVLPVAAIFVCTSFIVGCSGKGAITVTLNPSSTATINQAQTQNITATVANDSSNQGVTWSLGTSVGTLTNVTKTGVTYVAPSVVPISTTATVTATSVADTAATASLSITINAVLAIATTSLPVGTQNSSYFGVISATGATGTFTWILSSGTLPAGLTLGSSTSSSVTISGTPTATGTSKFTVQVTEGGTTVSQALSITINPPPPLSVGTKSLPNGTVGTLYSATLAASSGTAPYTWLMTSGSLPGGLGSPPGTLPTTGIISGTPTTAGTYTFTVQVTDSSSPPQTATETLSITINPSTAFNSKLNGTYAFLVSGFNSTSQYAIAGSLVADGSGTITSGVIDDPVNGLSGTNSTFTGTYLINSSDLGTMTLSIPGFGSRTFAMALTAPPPGSTASASAKLIECDDSTCSSSGSGILLQQNTSDFSMSLISGPYAFGFLGSDATGGRYALAGSFNASNGTFSNALLDSDDAGTASNIAFTGSYSIPTVNPPTGRGTATISISGKGTTNYCIYVVSSQELLALETDRISGSSEPLVSGTILQQAGPFQTGSLSAVSVFETTALNSGTALGQVGLFTPDGSGTMSTSFDQSTGGGVPVTSSGTYTVSSTTNGRVTLTTSGIASPDPVLYLVTSNEAFIVGADTGVTFGFMKPQTNPGTFSIASLSGTYAGGSLAPILSSASDQVDIAIADGAGNLTFTTDVASSGGLTQNQTPPSATYSLDTTGRGTETENSSTTAIFYLVSPTEFWSVSLNPNATIEIFQQ
jgi:Putative Ig domain